MRHTPGLAFCARLLILLLPGAVSAATPVAVFNFQMKSDTPDWKWLEKGLADRITTDFVSERVCVPKTPSAVCMVSDGCQRVLSAATR
ncbi:MAG: hypothetical protein NTY65_10100 [Planctomycetota bacterium]|nr:hypothetical protein [Planctomycetota bacterium]